MSKIDNFISKFFDDIKKRQSDKIIKNLRKEDKDLAGKMDKINNAYSELEQWVIDNYDENYKEKK